MILRNPQRWRRRIAPQHSNVLVEIAGGIASGKTTLLQALAEIGVHPVYESHALNPYWEDFYSDPGAYTFETEITFLLQHYHFAKRALQTNDIVVLDHSFELDLAYARLGLVGSRRRIFESIYDEVRAELGLPTALIWLRCSPEQELTRIHARNRDVEKTIDVKFLTDLNDHLESTIRSREAEDATSLCELDSEAIDFRLPGTWLESLAADLGIKRRS